MTQELWLMKKGPNVRELPIGGKFPTLEARRADGWEPVEALQAQASPPEDDGAPAGLAEYARGQGVEDPGDLTPDQMAEFEGLTVQPDGPVEDS